MIRNLLSLTFLFFLASCSKESLDNNNGKDIYLAGYSTNLTCFQACYWKNGERVELNGCDTLAKANSIVVVGNDVYVLGSIYEYGEWSNKVFWKNGVMFRLKTPPATGYPQANYITEHGGDIYIAGSIDGKPCYWKNGTPTILSDKSCRLTSIAVVGSDIYASAISRPGQKGSYWKNGVEYLFELDDNSSGAKGMAIAVDGNDIYILGQSNNYGTVGFYYKNGVLKSTINGGSLFTSLIGITVIKGDVYIAGWTTSGLNDRGKYWKNENSVFFTEEYQDSKVLVNAIANDGKNFYIVGWNNNGTYDTYWKNGVGMALTKNSFNYWDVVNAIYIK